MNYRITHSEGSSRLIIIFAGWGMDDNVFDHIRRPGYDIMVIWDYRNFFIDWNCVSRYSEICILAWSMGVYAASQTIQAIDSKITKKIAVGGTLLPVDDRFGIPEAIYHGTLQGLNAITLRKFFRRMCATHADFDHFMNHAPGRELEELKEELAAIGDRIILNTPSNIRWDLAITGNNDRIFPPENQIAAWNKCNVTVRRMPECGHYIDFQSIINSEFIDKTMVEQRFKAGTATYDDNAAVQIDVIERIDEKIRQYGIDRALMQARNNVLEVGSGSGLLSRKITRYINEAGYTMWDLAAPMPENLPLGRRYIFVNCDAESEINSVPDESVDHIVSASTIQWFNSPENFLKNCHRILRKGGYAIVSTFTQGNLHQISDITRHGLPLMTADDWANMAARYFNIVDSTAYERDLDFDNPLDALRHLKLTGVNSLGRASEISPRQLIARLPMMLDGRYHLTYKPLILILQKQ